MDVPKVVEELRAIRAGLSGQMVEAAHYLVNHPDDVAFQSMREIARRAEVPPVTLVRLAQRLGLPGYRELRDKFINAMQKQRRRDQSSTSLNASSAKALVTHPQSETTLSEFISTFFEAEQEVLRWTATQVMEQCVAEAAELLATAPRVFVAGKRTSYPTAFTLAYTLRKARPSVALLDGVGGAPEGSLDDVTPGDVLVVVTFAPFSKSIHQLVVKAVAAGVRVIAISNSFSAPIRKYAGKLLFVTQTTSRAFPESALGATALVNLLAASAIRKMGPAAERRIRDNERFLVGSGEYLLAEAARGRRVRGKPSPG
jgi:DNA-binding MurR/RpiR family transcriptional regulator